MTTWDKYCTLFTERDVAPIKNIQIDEPWGCLFLNLNRNLLHILYSTFFSKIFGKTKNSWKQGGKEL